jgi:hypothetical protein
LIWLCEWLLEVFFLCWNICVVEHGIRAEDEQRLRTDNGGEYVNNNFTSYCTTQGIQMQYNVPYTPQQNGVAERKNRTLKEMVDCMIQSKGLSLKYWAEAINCANYIVNRTPTKALKNITPEEAWTKIKLDVSHFRVFGNITWAHIPDEKRKALQPKSEKCIFVGYSEDVKGYRFLQPRCSQIIIRRDAKFDENLLACEPNSTFVPSFSYEPNSMFVPVVGKSACGQVDRPLRFDLNPRQKSAYHGH